MRALLLSGCLALVLLTQQAAAQTLLVVGDSISAALGLDTSQGWVALLQKRLADEGYDYRVVNASISGDTSAGGLARLPALLAEEKPALVVIELGGNDGLRGMAPAQLQQNLARMVDKSRQAGADPDRFAPRQLSALLAALDQAHEAPAELPAERGDFYTAYRAAPIRVEASYSTPIEHHNPMEPHASTVIVQPDGSLLALWSYKVTVVTDGLYGRKEALLRFGPDGRLANLVDSTNILLEPWERRNLLGPAPASEPLPDWALPKVEPGESYIYIPGPGESAGSRPQGG